MNMRPDFTAKTSFGPCFSTPSGKSLPVSIMLCRKITKCATNAFCFNTQFFLMRRPLVSPRRMRKLVTLRPGDHPKQRGSYQSKVVRFDKFCNSLNPMSESTVNLIYLVNNDTETKAKGKLARAVFATEGF